MQSPIRSRDEPSADGLAMWLDDFTTNRHE